jgi:hypothetical protein
MDDIREDYLGDQPPASEGVKDKPQGGRRTVGPESETRGGSAVDERPLDRPASPE